MNKVIKDFDLITTQDYRSVLNYLSTIPNLEVIGNGKKRIRIKLSITDNLGTTDSIEGDVRIIPSESFITGLVYLTGPASFNLKMRSIAKSKGYKLNEYSITTIPTKPYNVDKDEVVIHPKTELELFNLLGMNYLEPKNR
jgi:DNA polymerase (family 10)